MMNAYIITYGNTINYLTDADIIPAKNLADAKRKATRLAHDGYDINIWDSNQVQRLARRPYIGGGNWGAWENADYA